jgi:hypothetical protein
MKEMKQRLAEGKSLYGETDQPEWIQGIAARYSTFSQLKFRKSDASRFHDATQCLSRVQSLTNSLFI